MLLKNKHVFKQGLHQHFLRRLLGVLSLGIVLASAIGLFLTLDQFEHHLRPRLVVIAQAVSNLLARDIEYAVYAGVPFTRLAGLDELFEATLEQYPQIEKIELLPLIEALENAPIEPVSQAVSVSPWQTLGHRLLTDMASISTLWGGSGIQMAPIEQSIVVFGNALAKLQVHINTGYVTNQMIGVFLDTGVLLLAAILLTIQLIVAAVAFLYGEPIRWLEATLADWRQGKFPALAVLRSLVLRQALRTLADKRARLYQRVADLRKQWPQHTTRLRALQHFAEQRQLLHGYQSLRVSHAFDIRLPLFLALFADKLQSSFLPLYTAERLSADDIFAAEMMMALPMAGFMLLAAVVTPFTSHWVERIGYRRLFLLSLVSAMLGHWLCVLATNGNTVVLARSLAGLGFGIMLTTAQCYVLRLTTPQNQSRDMLGFAGIIVSAILCGTIVGALLADKFGYLTVFTIATGLVIFAMVLGYVLMTDSVPPPVTTASPESTMTRVPFLKAIRRNACLAALLLAALLTGVVLNGFLYLFVPVYFASLGLTTSTTGRVLMAYPLVILLLLPFAASIAERINRKLLMAALGIIVMGGVICLLPLSSAMIVIFALIAAIGIAELLGPLSLATLQAAANDPAISANTALSLVKVIERTGSMLGSLLIGGLLVLFSPPLAALVLGGVIISLGVIVFIVMISAKQDFRDA